MILIIDNYDSFTYNLFQIISALGERCEVHRNDALSIADLKALRPRALVISPGPGNPDSAGISLEAIRSFAPEIPVLGVCLGHQAIGQVFGGQVVRAKKPMHGKVSRVSHDGRGIFRGLVNPFSATRYHSLVVDPASLPEELEVSARTSDGLVMGLRHKRLPVEGVQFHPESVMTEAGVEMFRNFLRTNS